jgi:hypothetical protein
VAGSCEHGSDMSSPFYRMLFHKELLIFGTKQEKKMSRSLKPATSSKSLPLYFRKSLFQVLLNE